jgi:hypothetical protein
LRRLAVREERKWRAERAARDDAGNAKTSILNLLINRDEIAREYQWVRPFHLGSFQEDGGWVSKNRRLSRQGCDQSLS